MDRVKRPAILVAVSLIAAALLIGRWFLESNSKSENALAWEGAAPDIEETFASKRLAAPGSGNATKHWSASSHRASDQAEGEWVRAASALDQAHARLAATSIAVAQAEAAVYRVERRIAELKALGEDSAAQLEEGEEPFVQATKAHARANIEREKSLRERAMEQANVSSAEERVKAAELQLQSSLLRE